MKPPFHFRVALAGGVAVTCALISTTAAAQDEVRFRGGVGLDAGGLILGYHPADVLGSAGIQGQVGVQINDLIGIYAAPNLDFFFGNLGGVALDFAVLADLTLSDRFSVGAGPEAVAFAIIGDGGVIGGALEGARLRLAVYPLVEKDARHHRRKALAIGLDLRIFGSDLLDLNHPAGFLFWPSVSASYQAF